MFCTISAATTHTKMLMTLLLPSARARYGPTIEPSVTPGTVIRKCWKGNADGGIPLGGTAMCAAHDTADRKPVHVIAVTQQRVLSILRAVNAMKSTGEEEGGKDGGQVRLWLWWAGAAPFSMPIPMTPTRMPPMKPATAISATRHALRRSGSAWVMSPFQVSTV
jgi:hypothetical protein